MADRSRAAGVRPSDISGADAFVQLCAGAAGPLLDSMLDRRRFKRLLDVGSGTGTVARLAAGRGLEPIGVDPSPSVHALISDPAATWARAELPALPFTTDALDAVAGNFVINHVAEPLLSVREMRRVLRSNGVVGLTLWHPDPSALSALWSDVVESADAIPVAGERLPPDKDFARDATGLGALLAEGGFKDVEHRDLEWEFIVSPRVLWEAPRSGTAGIGTLFMRQTAEVQARMEAAFFRLVQRHLCDGMVVLPAKALVLTAVR